MKFKHLTHKSLISLAFFILALLLFVFSHSGATPDNDLNRVAQRLERNVQARVRQLDQYLLRVQEADADGLMAFSDVPDDMVIYKYVNDSLQSWCNQFSVVNDDISAKLVFHRLTNLKNTIISPLAEVTEDLSYMNFGPKWYIVKSVKGVGTGKIIAGIEIQNTLIKDYKRSENGVNPVLRLPKRYSIVPLNNSGGISVSIEGKPLFKVIHETDYASPLFDNTLLRWISLLFFVIASVLFLAGHRTMKTYFFVLLLLFVVLMISKDCNSTRFVKNLREGKKTRYVSAYELIIIWQGLGYNAFDLIKKYEGEERYKKIIHSLYKKKQSNSTEYRMIQANMEQIYLSAIDNVDNIIASQKDVT